MAAYASLLSLSQAIQYVLPRDEQDYISFSTKDQLISLHQNVISLQEFLEAVPMKFTSKISPLERRVTEVAYQLEDLIESTSVEGGSLCESVVPGDHVTLVPTTVFNSCIEEVSAILQEAEEMFKQQDIDMSSAHDSSSTPSSSVVVESSSNDANVGLDEGLKQIVQRVTGGTNALQVIPIVGMGGIGKTTLARAIYEEIEKQKHFDVYCWVTISQQYNIQDILMRLLLGQEKSAGRTEQDLGSLITSVYQKLFRKRFLIVLDDMWDAEAWNCAMTAIPKDSNGSRVILTTRLSGVAETVSSASPQHQMSLLNEDQSWDLLRKKVYGQEICSPEFEAVGRRIAENCKGLPVQIVVVAGMLKSNMTRDYWEEAERNIDEAAARAGDGQLDGVLSLSYDNLPPHLKSCFLYFGAYPEDFYIEAERIIHLWVAEGFVKPKASKTLEEIGEEYLEDLIRRSLVFVRERNFDGKIVTCGIHDMLRELSIIKATEDKFLQCFTGGDDIKHGVTFQNIIKSQRRASVLSIKNDSLSFLDADDDTCNTPTRSLLFLDDDEVPTVDQLVWLRLKLLKVLHGVKVSRESMFSHLFELTNLRLLHFKVANGTPIMVPKSISSLQKLETLIVDTIRGGRRLIFPVDIWKIHKLRHILLPMICTLESPPTEPSEAYPVLQDLQTLQCVENLALTESVRMPNLKVLESSYQTDDLSDYVTKYGLKNLVHLSKLEHLFLQFKTSASCLPGDFVFPINLKRLHLWGDSFFCSWEQMSSMVGSLPNLQSLILGRWVVEGRTWEPEVGQFLELKYLKMVGLELECWLADSTHFPRLEVLELKDMEELEEIPVDIGYIPTLKKMEVKYCSKEAKRSAEEIQEEQQGLANHALQVEISDYEEEEEEDDDDDEEEE